MDAKPGTFGGIRDPRPGTHLVGETQDPRLGTLKVGAKTRYPGSNSKVRLGS